MNATITAIQTTYKGCRFRSRLEARWAVFFDALGIAWEYEPQGFMLDDPSPRGYLPDFYLPGPGTWVEVKGSSEQLDYDMVSWLCEGGSPLPGMQDSYRTTRGLLILGPVPQPSDELVPTHALGQHHKGVCFSRAIFSYGGLVVLKGAGGLPGWFEPEMRLTEVTWVRHVWAGLAANAYQAARSARFEHGEVG